MPGGQKLNNRLNNKLNNKNEISALTNLIIHAVFALYVVLCISPLLLVVMASVTDESTLNANGFSFFPAKFSSLAYSYIFSDSGQIVKSYGVSIFVTVVGTVLSVLIISLYAYPLSRKDFKYRGFFSFMVFFTMLFSGGLVPWYLVYAKLLKVNDTLLALIMPMLVTPIYVIIMKTFFSTTIPDSIVESAKIDGANDVRIFFAIVLRLSTPALATIGLFDSLQYWNDWFNSMMFITKENLVPLQLLLYRVQSSLTYLIQMTSQTGQGAMTLAQLPGQSARMALCVVAIGPIILAYPFFQKYFIKGLTIGAVKG